LEKSLDFATRAAKLSPKSGTILDTLGWIYFLKGDLEEALASFEKAYEYNPYLPVIPFHVGLSQFHLKRYEEAEKNLKLALNMKGTLEEKDEARELLNKILEITKD
ncbi:MAG: tetratricopeptide repeat protein, partial [bacterium]